MRHQDWALNIHKNIEEFSKTELRRCVLKFLVRSSDFSFINHIFFTVSLRKYNKKYSISSFRRTSIISGYPRSVSRFFKLSRHENKYYASFGKLVGVRKSSF